MFSPFRSKPSMSCFSSNVYVCTHIIFHLGTVGFSKQIPCASEMESWVWKWAVLWACEKWMLYGESFLFNSGCGGSSVVYFQLIVKHKHRQEQKGSFGIYCEKNRKHIRNLCLLSVPIHASFLPSYISVHTELWLLINISA